MIRLTFNNSDTRIAAALQARGAQIIDSLAVAVDRSMIELQKRIQEKLSGEVLQQITGKLLGSVNKSPVTKTETTVTGKVTSSAGPAFYGAIQEKGSATGQPYEILPKNKKALAFFPTGSPGASLGRTGLTKLYNVSGKNRGFLRKNQYENFGSQGGVVVQKVIHPPIVARPFMSTALEELRNKIISNIREAAVRAVS